MSFKKYDLSDRGFVGYNFIDHYGEKCSIQESSLASEHAIWLGLDDVKPTIMSSTAIDLGLKPREYNENDNGWWDIPMPEGTQCFGRMHLTQSQVKGLLPLLTYFAEHGRLPADMEESK